MVFTLVLFILYFSSTFAIGNPESSIKIAFMPDLAKEWGYKYENHTLVTKDGYILTVGRLPESKNSESCAKSKGPVICIHGTLSNGGEYMLHNQSMAYQLADNCYDVWILNTRGCMYSLSHKNMSYHERAFWNFGHEEVALNDLADCIDYVRNYTKKDKLHVIAYSQGVTQFWMLSAIEPSYQKYIKTSHWVAPIVFMENFNVYVMKSPILRKMAKNKIMYERPFPDEYDLFWTFYRDICAGLSPLCSQHFNLPFRFPQDIEKDVTSHADKSSLKQFVGFLQLHLNGKTLRRFDYGDKENLQIYGTEIPPAFDLSKIKVPIHLYYSTGDGFSTVEDVEMIKSALPNVVSSHLIKENDFSHYHFSDDNRIINLIIEALNKYDN